MATFSKVYERYAGGDTPEAMSRIMGTFRDGVLHNKLKPARRNKLVSTRPSGPSEVCDIVRTLCSSV